jgi:hypothetical protein
MAIYVTTIKEMNATKQTDCPVHYNKGQSMINLMEPIASLKTMQLVTKIKGPFAMLKVKINVRLITFHKIASQVMA